ncbi:uncharacterized protein PFL1_02268 [Pseudozyma flocculosa PF-1]|uniref:Uncharacterized protein n=1 Tax=Pseudozyma flocculosa TaxID=84751 RepID=A0A5C3F961_9BASI|nr:uncharacterized protein PFL1_02268 [Pseudozyma flocculosa PF-1]EPQ30151.1 hypothetical protein PFL1_02268 [Pseudozyma flocculosa PF-1]SPO39921.1 uncharacterized protein PSFLO_05402 [Pseudozyma flocculosa]
MTSIRQQQQPASSSYNTGGPSTAINPSSSSSSSSSSSTTTSATAAAAANANASASGPSSQHPQVSLLGTVPLVHLAGLLAHVTRHLTTLPPLDLLERETLLARHDDVASSVREKHDNAWAAVVRSRRGVRLRVKERLGRYDVGVDNEAEHEVECQLALPLPPLPERQYPRVTVRPAVNVQVLAQPTSSRLHSSSKDRTRTTSTSSFSTPFLPLPPSCLDTDATTGWRTLTSALGWTPSFSFIRYGLEFILDDQSARARTDSGGGGSSNPLQPTTDTLHILRIYRIFRPDPTGYLHGDDDDDEEAEWVPLDPDGHTVVIELTSTVGGKLDATHFTHASVLASTPSTGQGRSGANAAATAVAGALDKDTSLEDAIAHIEAVAKSLRGFVDLKREKVDF